MSDEDDYLSDKFLVEATSSSIAPKTYAERRKDALKRTAQKNAQNRIKSLKEREREAREEALNRSLFERAQEEAQESGRQSKALTMMMKMGFKPGQALGRGEEVGHGEGDRDGDGLGDQVERSAEGEEGSDTPARVLIPKKEEEEDAKPARAGIGASPFALDALEAEAPVKVPAGPSTPSASTSQRTVPLAISEWQGKKGIGLGKRTRSPTAPERVAKMARMAEERTHASFRDRARQEYQERRAAGRLHPAQRTCVTLDEKAGIQFNVLWLNPESPETFPEGLLDALDDPALVTPIQQRQAGHSIEGRLRAQMQADALRPLKSTLEDLDEEGDDGIVKKAELRKEPYSQEELQEAVQFLRLGTQDRLTLVLDYLRRKYAYCFWCGTQYENAEDMENSCPGEDEDAHD